MESQKSGRDRAVQAARWKSIGEKDAGAHDVGHRAQICGGAQDGLQQRYFERPVPEILRHSAGRDTLGRGPDQVRFRRDEDCIPKNGGLVHRETHEDADQGGPQGSANTAAEGYAHHVHANVDVHPPSSGASVDHCRGNGQSTQACAGRAGDSGSIVRDRVGLAGEGTRPAFYGEGGLGGTEHDELSSEHRSSSICQGEGVQELVSGDLHASRAYHSYSSGILEKAKGGGGSIWGRHEDIRQAEGSPQEGDAGRFVAALHSSWSLADDQREGVGPGAEPQGVAPHLFWDDEEVPELSELREKGGAEGFARPAAAAVRGEEEPLCVRRLMAKAKYPGFEQKGKGPIFRGSAYGERMRGPGREREARRVDDFPKGLLDYGVLRRLAAEVNRSVEFLKWCTDGEWFQRSLSSPIPLPGPPTDMRPSFVEACTKAGVLTPVGRSDVVRGVVAMFDIPKSDPAVRRLILDGRPVNRRTPKPPPFLLPGARSVGRFLSSASARWGMIIDLKGFFNQFPLSKGVASFFGVRVGSRWFTWGRLPMGFAHAPYIAQSTGEIFLGRLLNLSAIIYLDDILVVGESREEVRAKAAYVLGRIQETGGEVNKKKSMENPAERFVYNGVEWDLPDVRFRLPQKWREEAVASMQTILAGQTQRLRDWWIVVGLAFRVAFIHKIPLCYLCGVLQFIRQQGKRVSEGLIAWDEQTTLPGSARCELSGLIVNEMVPNRWHYQQRTPPAEKSGVAWSDASTTGWGYITKRKGEKRGVARYGMWEIEGCSGDMFFLELLAAEKAVEALLLQGCRDLLVMVDNESVQYVVTRGHSKTRRGNQTLRRVLARLKECNATLEVQWIPGGDDMPADCWSRMKAWGTKVVGVNLVGVLETERGFSAKKDS